jgi:hypothetical protein
MFPCIWTKQLYQLGFKRLHGAMPEAHGATMDSAVYVRAMRKKKAPHIDTDDLHKRTVVIVKMKYRVYVKSLSLSLNVLF